MRQPTPVHREELTQFSGGSLTVRGLSRLLGWVRTPSQGPPCSKLELEIARVEGYQQITLTCRPLSFPKGEKSTHALNSVRVFHEDGPEGAGEQTTDSAQGRAFSSKPLRVSGGPCGLDPLQGAQPSGVSSAAPRNPLPRLLSCLFLWRQARISVSRGALLHVI